MLPISFEPLRLMMGRVERYGAESDSALFVELLYAGEFILRATTAAFIAGLEDDRESNRYRLIHGLIRADGIGDWAKALDEALVGPASHHLASELSEERRAFTERHGKDAWQYQAVDALNQVLDGINGGAQSLGDKAALRTWFQLFAELRNKTRGHGATTPAKYAELVPLLSRAVELLAVNNPIFKLPWAYLHRNLSGKYRVENFNEKNQHFDKLKSSAAVTGVNLVNGIYFFAGNYRRVELIHTDLDTSDYFTPNGAFRGTSYELHSLITDNRLKGDASPYLAVASERPPSETEGGGELDVVGNVFTNLPGLIPNYVSRPHLEKELLSILTNDRHPIVTLVGRGGIGKTSLALSVLTDLTTFDRFQAIIWFSARDIDLLASGAKPVKPKVLTDKDIATEYIRLIGSVEKPAGQKTLPIQEMAQHLRSSPIGATLFVFDNFETTRNPVDLFQWIDTNIRTPNKALITTRFREFKADYPVEVSGMEDAEAKVLIEQTAHKLGISSLIGNKETEQIIEESNAHPYIIKIILGEMASSGSFVKPSKIVARKDDILDALFERTFANLSPIASRIFLTLSGWRSLVPQLAVEAVLWRNGGLMDPGAGVDELVRMSLVERTTADDGAEFLQTPITAALFGKRKLETSPQKSVIESDLKFLQDIGATSLSGLKAGIRPRIEEFFKKAARRINEDQAAFEDMRVVLEFMATGYAPAWLLLSEMQEEIGGPNSVAKAADYVRRFLETQPAERLAQNAWQRLFALYRRADDVIGGCGAFLKAAESSEPTLNDISIMANWLNTSTAFKEAMGVSDRGPLLKPLITLLENHLPEASATDLSRLAWLYLHEGNETRALEVAELGLKREPDSIFCQRLIDKLS